MKILVLNRGSSSIKCSLFSFESKPKQFVPPIWEAHLQWKNQFDNPILEINSQSKEKIKQKTSTAALKYLLQFLRLEQIDVVGHRIVHGGSFFKKSVVIDASVKKKIGQLADLAPLHNLADLEGIELIEKLMPKTPQIAVFDTAFHHTMPTSATVYPGPYKWFEAGIRKYGFHGTSFQYCTKTVAQLLKKMPKRMVICHLGSGASLCAVKDGKSVDTTMGFTPLDGLMMDTRCGSIDPGILLYLQKKKVVDLSHTLYKESGLLGVSGISSDMRDIIEKKNDPRAKLALEVYIHRLISSIGSMVATLGGLDVLVFTAGIGENAPLIRKRVLKALSFISKVKVLVIHTEESFEIARECYEN